MNPGDVIAVPSAAVASKAAATDLGDITGMPSATLSARDSPVK
jgi:hypothetical protein